jgi:gliding motility-associated-like protein
MNVTSHTVLLSKSIIIEKSVIAIESTIMSQFVRYTSLFLLILVSVLPHSFGQCPAFNTNATIDNINTFAGEFDIIGFSGGMIHVLGNQDPSELKICEGETITLKNSRPSTDPNAPLDYYLIHAESYANNQQVYPTNTSTFTPTASYNPTTNSNSGTAYTFTANSFGYNYKGNGVSDTYYLIQKSSRYEPTLGQEKVNFSCKVLKIISPTITKPNFTLASCIDGSAVVSLPVDANNNIFYDYNVVYKDKATGGAFASSTGSVISYPKNITQFISSTSKNYEITVTGKTQTGGCVGASTTKDITIKKASQPKAGLIIGQATNGTYEVEFIAEKGIKREVFIREANANYNYAVPFSNFISGDPTTRDREIKIYTVPDATKQYCFIARAVESNSECPLIGTEVVADEEACTTTLTITQGDKKNKLTWSPFVTGMLGGSFQAYDIYREGTVLPIKRITAAGTTSYDDDDASLVCGTTYKYTVVTNYGATSTSKQKDVTFNQTTKASSYDMIYATVSEDNSTVTLTPSNANGSKPPIDAVINIYRKEFNSGTFSKYVVESQDKIKGIFFSEFEDKQVETTKKQYCYYVTWELGLCGESKPSAEVCTILLKKTGEDLTWTPETPMSKPKGDYNIDYAKDPNSGFLASSPTFPFNAGTTTSYDLTSIPNIDGQEFYLRIGVRPSSGTGPVSYSNYIYYKRPLAVLLPQIFTPDGNAMNETFDIQGKHIRKTKMWIYDRWGSPIFYKEAENKEDVATGLWIDTGWDGKLSSGQKAPQGNYVYKVEIEDSVGKVSIKTGSFILTY